MEVFLGILIALAIICIIFCSVLLVKYKKAMFQVCDLIDDDEKTRILEIGDEVQSEIEDLDNNEMKDYRNAQNSIRDKVRDEKGVLSKRASAEQQRIQSVFRPQITAATRVQDTASISAINQRMQGEIQSVKQQLNAAFTDIDNQAKQANRELDQEYADVLARYKQLKDWSKGSHLVAKIFKKVAKTNQKKMSRIENDEEAEE